ncbi:histone H2A-beta, sperm-like [Elephas maximus indicus]|uniref:histone H2A-beta, sperm-like n=1 Tax=Elephas maximus indicus TaxID=99487 RepID=UPI0002235C6C|nr:histone H2A-beta, sperm-like [Loxodonta africana]XP_049760999.1 histone H2A-beta, sperm-like [Elephas maximus indicus]
MTGKRRHRNCHRRRKRVNSRCAQARLRFPKSCMNHLLREGHYSHRLSSSTPDFLAAILEYLISSILELADNEARNDCRKRITPQDVDMAVCNHPELSRLFRNASISQVNKMP